MIAVLHLLQVFNFSSFEAEVSLKNIEFLFCRSKKQLDVNVLLTDGVVLLDQAGGPHHPVALPQVPPPHMLVCDLDDVAYREPALLAV